MNTKRTLSKNESQLILNMEWRQQTIISLAEIQFLLRASESYAAFVAYRLVKKGWLERLRAGVYQLIPANRGLEGIGDTNPLVDVNVFQVPSFYSFGTACSFYGFTEQAFMDVYLVSSKRRTPLKIRGKKYIFAHVPDRRFFGFEKTDVFGQKTELALPERAVLDALDRPGYAGGLAEVSRIIRKAAPKLEYNRVIDFLRKWKQSSIVQRFGYFLDLHQIALPPEIRSALKKLINPKNKIYLAPRKRSKEPASFFPEWMIVENIPRALLVEGTGDKTSFVAKRRERKD